MPQWEELTVATIAGSQVGLQTSLLYDHAGARNLDGVLDGDTPAPALRIASAAPNMQTPFAVECAFGVQMVALFAVFAFFYLKDKPEQAGWLTVHSGLALIVIGGLTALVGLGLIVNVDLARGIVNVLAFLNILFGCIGLVMLFFLAPFQGFWGLVALLQTFLDIGLAGFMIFPIGETETRGPNF